jgi:hypothetical protein
MVYKSENVKSIQLPLSGFLNGAAEIRTLMYDVPLQIDIEGAVVVQGSWKAPYHCIDINGHVNDLADDSVAALAA